MIIINYYIQAKFSPHTNANAQTEPRPAKAQCQGLAPWPALVRSFPTLFDASLLVLLRSCVSRGFKHKKTPYNPNAQSLTHRECQEQGAHCYASLRKVRPDPDILAGLRFKAVFCFAKRIYDAPTAIGVCFANSILTGTLSQTLHSFF